MIKEIKGIRLEAEFINYLNEYTEVKSIDSSFMHMVLDTYYLYHIQKDSLKSIILIYYTPSMVKYLTII